MKLKSISLLSNQVEKQKKFYSELLGFEINESDNGFAVEAGSTELKFTNHPDEKVFYHFAFLIADNHFEDCLKYIKQKGIEILPDKNTSEEITFWDNNTGRSFYFYDADHNIVEFITRPSLQYNSHKAWNINEVIKINEIGTPVTSPLETTNYLLKNYTLSIPQNNIDRFNDTFCWFGSYEGTLLVVKKGRNWYPTDHPAISSDLKIHIGEGEKEIILNFINGQFT